MPKITFLQTTITDIVHYFLLNFGVFHLFFSIFAQLSKSDGNLKDITRQKVLRLHMYNE